MPMESQAQWRYLFATDKPFARRWARETPGGKGRRYRRLQERVKAGGFGARAGEVIRGNLKRGNDGKFTSAGGGGDSAPKPAASDAAESTDSPKKPPARAQNAAARRERATAEAETRAQEADAEQAKRDEEDAKLDSATTPQERNALRQQIARDRRARATELRTARRERQAAERAARTAEDAAASEQPEQAPKDPKAVKPKKGGGGGGGGKQDKPEDPAKAAEAAERKREQEARRAEVLARRAEADARRAAADAKRAAAEGERAERTQRELTDLTQRAQTPGMKLSDSEWSRLVVEGLAARDGSMVRLTPAGQQQAKRAQKTKAIGDPLRVVEHGGHTIEGNPTVRHAYQHAKQYDEVSQQWLDMMLERGWAERRADGSFVLRSVDPEPTAEKAGSFAVFKDARGDYRWIAISSTAFRDKDNEIVSRKALEADCARADADGDYGPLRWWHCPGVDIGDCDYNAVSGRTLIEMGTFRSPALARAAKEAAPDLELSLGFKHLPTEPGPDGIYSFIRRFERSLTPKGRASNLFTAFAVTKEHAMTPEKLKAALEKLGSNPEARALMEDIISQAQTREKEADAAGVAFKAAEAEAADLPVYALPDGTQGVIVDGAFVALKAAMPPAEMIEAGETEAEDGAIEEDADDAPDMLLSEAEITMIADRVAAALMSQLDGIAAKMTAVDEELKGRGYQKMKEASETTLPAIAATLTKIKTTVDALNGDAPRRRGHKPSEDNEDLNIEQILNAAIKARGISPSADPLDSVVEFFHPAPAEA